MSTIFKRDALGLWAPADPDSDLDYAIGLKDWLAPGEIIADAVWTVAAGITQHDAQINSQALVIDGVTHPAGTLAIVWLAFGTVVAGQAYVASCHVTTNSTPPRVDDRSFRLVINER